LKQKIYALFLCVMKTCSIMEAQHNLAALVRRVEVEGELVITRRRKPVARLVPLEKPPLVFPDFKARAHKIWGGAWQGAGSDELLDESRGAQ
jgi:prevent-host-death family protein